MNSKKAISNIIVIVLLVALSALGGTGIFIWYTGLQSDYEVKQQSSGNLKNLEVLGVKYVNEQKAIVGLKNPGQSYHIVQTIKINDLECDVIGSNVVETVNELSVNCPVEFDENVNVELVSDKGVSSKRFTAFEIEEDPIQNFANATLTVNLRNSISCNADEVKLFAMADTNASHLQLPALNDYDYSVCANHTLYELGTSCSGDFTRLFYLGDENNSHIWFDISATQAEPFTFYYDYRNVCVSAPGASLTTTVASSSPGSAYECLASVDRDNTLGGVVGQCSSYSDKIWLLVE